MNWKPIETAPKDKRILLFYSDESRVHSRVVCGAWNDDKYNRKPRPYWSNDLVSIFGLNYARAHVPTHWMTLPEKPEAQQ
jgi:hypothetical protein